MNFELPYEIQLVKDQLRHLVDREIIPIEREACEGPDMVPEIRAMLETKARDMGLWHVLTPERYGGLGMGLLMRVVMWEELGRTIAIPTRKTQIFGPEISPMLLQLTEDQETDYLLPVIAGKKDCCFALTEPEAGSDPGGIRTIAVRDGDHYVVNGYKRFITNAENADFIQLMATTDRSKGAKGITAFLVDVDTPGVRMVRKQETMMDDEPWDIAFDDVRVPVSNRIGEEGEGFKLAQEWINIGRIRHGARALGVIERCLELSVEYTQIRSTFGKPLSQRQAIRWMLVDSYLDLEKLRPMVYRAAWKYDRGDDIRYDAFAVKMLGDKMAFEAADRSIQIHGGIALTKELPIEKFWRDQRSMMITEGPEEVLRDSLATHILNSYSSN